MKDKKSLVSKCLFGGGLLALICGVFCFFGSATVGSTSMPIPGGLISISVSVSSLFSFMFGSTATINATVAAGSESESFSQSGTVDLVGGTTALFAIEMVIVVLAAILLVGAFTKKLQKKYITIGSCVTCILAIAAVILAFCSKKMIIDAIPDIEGTSVDIFKLGSAGISYGVLGIVGILATGAGLFLGKDATVTA
ncbi:MAG: hypothetical protein MJ213_02075 [Bacilli bacterium]|nr:hypothetical protein [Bacilli bacterium]